MRRLASCFLLTAACGKTTHLVDSGAADAPAPADGAVVADAGLTPCTKPTNNELTFAGGQWVAIPDSPSLRPTDLTIEAWARFDGLPGVYQTIVAKPIGPSTGDSYAVWMQGGQLNAGVNPTSPSDAIGEPFSPTLGQWYQLTFTYDHATSTQKLYVDGAVVAMSTTAATPAYDTNPVYIGGDTNGGAADGFFDGAIDEVKIWDSVRSLSDVGLDLHSCTPGSFTGLRAYWALDEGTGQTTADLSGNANTGTLGTTPSADTADPTWAPSTVPF